MKPNGLVGGGVDDLPNVDAEPVAEHRQLVDERDVDRAEDVLEQLGELGGVGAADLDHRVADLRVELDRALGARVGQPTDELRGGADRVVGAARVDSLWREGEVEVPARRETGFLEDRRSRSRVVPG